MESQLKILVRAMFSNPPIHGARIVAKVLDDKDLTDLWREEVKGMANRIISMSKSPFIFWFDFRTQTTRPSRKGFPLQCNLHLLSRNLLTMLVTMVSHYLTNRYYPNSLKVPDFLGMFCYSGLSADQVDRLMREHHVYLTKDGRISVAGVTSGNVKYIALS